MTIRYTAIWPDSGNPYYLTEPLHFGSLDALQADLEEVAGVEEHQVTLGAVRLDDMGKIRWSTWSPIETMTVGDKD